VENFCVVQCATIRSRPNRRTRINTGLFALSTVKPHGGMAALRSAFGHSAESTHRKYRHRFPVLTESGPDGAAARYRKPKAAAADFGQNVSEKKRPVRGDNRTGQAIWALGVDGRSRRIQPMGRDYRSHIDKSQQARRTFKTSDDFFNFFIGRFRHAFRGFAAKNPGKITVPRGDWGRLPQICPTRSRAQSHSTLCSRKRYCDRALFPRQADRKPRRRAPKGRRSRS
jgi:hypothetical protein